MEALETAVGYWEDALAAYTSSSTSRQTLTTMEEAEFARQLDHLLELSYGLQDESEHLFLHEHSVLFPAAQRAMDGHELDRRTISISSPESFVSAQDEVANLRDFEDFADLPLDADAYPLYQSALQHLDEKGIPYRSLRTLMVHCTSDAEYLAKLHCVRLAFQYLFREETVKLWFAESGRKVLVGLLLKAEKDPKDFLVAYDKALEFVMKSDHWTEMEIELRDRGVRALTFFDIVMDYIFMDAFEDLENPPSTVVAVMQNRWLSNGFKETAMTTVLWSILKAKRGLLKYQHGFSSHFYDIMEHISPPVAWGFLGPDEHLKELCAFFKDQVTGFLEDIFSFQKVHYTTVDELSRDIFQSAQQRYKAVEERLDLLSILGSQDFLPMQ